MGLAQFNNSNFRMKGFYIFSNCFDRFWVGASDCLTILPVALPPESSISWVAALTQFLVTLLAAALSFLVARWTLSKSAKTDMERLRLERRDQAQGKALTVAFKILNYGELLAGLERHLSKQFKQAALDGFESEPFQIIRPTQGKDFTPEIVNPSEMSFLIEQQKFDLMGQIMLLYRRTLNATHLMTFHSNERTAFEEWIHQLPGHEGKLDGDVANDAIPKEFEDGYNRRAANLNIIITDVVEQVDETLELLPMVFEEFVQACRAEFGEGFPQISAEYPHEKVDLETLRVICSSSGIPFRIGAAQPRDDGSDGI
ncbi:hypothetical protein [Sulfitobacter sp. CW3]|uniref:hypothetical protein n=1 Tax=Sulfitobacter sp. CW3 TaxID=2861965 RepID=UPI001C5F5829|nr:hypothetical protein [Sulfitobacter sp. CW3]MBW4962119.1 hypothetical protein [Sulfitobacter sp. CW3]